MLRTGDSGNFAKRWQSYLKDQGLLVGAADGKYGPMSTEATKAFQRKHGLTPDGVVGAGTFRVAAANGWPAPDGYPFIGACSYREADRKIGDIYWVVIHTMEVPEKSNMAFEIGQRFTDNNPYSAHFCASDIEVVQNVLLKDVAFHASDANRKGIGIEHAGYAGQFPAEWHDAFSMGLLRTSAKLTADLCGRFGLPPVWLTGPDLVAGKKGITGHKQVNDAFNDGKGHFDPGPHFPAAEYVEMVKQAMAA